MAHASIYANLGREEIRVLTVHPGTRPSALDCSLNVRPLPPVRGQSKELGTANQIQYDAISYSWDGQQPTHPVRFRRTDGGFNIFNVTKNVLEALEALRDGINLRNFWVDAICVNQENLLEKNEQLPLMSRIYGNATNVRVWLGPENDESQLAFSLIHKMRVMEDLDYVVEEKSTCQEWMALASLMKRNWFSRRWVVQEVTLAARVVIYCGTTMIPWAHFAEAIALFEIMADRVKAKFRKDPGYGQHPDIFGDIGEFSAIRLVETVSNVVRRDDGGRVVQKAWSLEALVSGLTPFQAGRFHDVVYAMLSLARDISGSSPMEYKREIDVNNIPESLFKGRNELQIKRAKEILLRVFRHLQPSTYPVNYEKSTYEVCRDFLQFTTRTSKSLDAICRPWAPVQIQTSSREKLPSYIRTVADAPFGRDSNGHWCRKNANTLVGMPGQSPYRASLTVPGEWSFGEDRILSVKGFELDIVHDVKDVALCGNIPASWLHYGNLAGIQYRPSKTATDANTVTESFWRTMVAGRGPNGDSPPPYYSLMCEKTFTTVIEYDGDVYLGQIYDRSTNTLQKCFIKRVHSVVWSRKLVKTKRHNFLALAPRATTRGDRICILLGCSVPVVLRIAESQGNQPVYEVDGEKETNGKNESDQPVYEFIGESYVHGVMDGQAFDIRTRAQIGYTTFKIQ